MRKKLDARLTALLARCLKGNQRALLVLVGDRARYQVVNLHYLLVKERMKARPKVLWCYKKELGFSSHQKKRMKEVKHLQKKGVYEEEMDDPFELFIAQGDINYCYYKESHRVLGQTYQMLVLQDFEALTPNLLCRTIETVEGGGLVILMLKTMTSLKQLYTLSMDVHRRYRTEAFSNVEPRFNERFILSLAGNPNALVMDDELNVLPISAAEIVPEAGLEHRAQEELQKLKGTFQGQDLVGQLIELAKTLDQAKALLAFIDDLSKSDDSIVSITAPRGRGKSACVGLCVAAAVKHGHSNIFLTAPSPTNLGTVF
jgi:N-acetyltransferase 10